MRNMDPHMICKHRLSAGAASCICRRVSFIWRANMSLANIDRVTSERLQGQTVLLSSLCASQKSGFLGYARLAAVLMSSGLLRTK